MMLIRNDPWRLDQTEMIRASNRRVWVMSVIAILIGFGLMLDCAVVQADELAQAGASSEVVDASDLDIIDCHTHFYDPSRPEGVPWPDKDSALYRTVLPRHFRDQQQYRPVTGTIIVEANARLEDNAWLLNLAEADPFVVGIVGRLEPGSADFAKHLRRFAANPLFRGIRVSVAVIQRLLDRDQLDDLTLLADRGLMLDVNGGPQTPAVIAQLAARVPKLRIVLNHIGNVGVTSAPPPEAWQAGIQAAAKHPNVFCKVSALVESAAHHSGQPAPDNLEFYRAYLDVVWNAFGEDRLIYASNWPVSERGASYETLQRLVFEYVSEHGTEATKKFASLNSKRAYQWTERPGRRNGTNGL